jgi:hypothetical protein
MYEVLTLARMPQPYERPSRSLSPCTHSSSLPTDRTHHESADEACAMPICHIPNDVVSLKPYPNTCCRGMGYAGVNHKSCTGKHPATRGDTYQSLLPASVKWVTTSTSHLRCSYYLRYVCVQSLRLCAASRSSESVCLPDSQCLHEGVVLIIS